MSRAVTDEKDFNVKVSVRNGRMLRKIREKSPTIVKFCKDHEISYVTTLNLLGMRMTPFLKDGQLRPIAIKICEALNCVPQDIWPDYISNIKLSRPSAEIEMSISEAQQICGKERFHQRILLEKLSDALTNRQLCVIGMLQNGSTLDEVGSVLGVTPQRVRQIESKAIFKMRKRAAWLGVNYMRDV